MMRTRTFCHLAVGSIGFLSLALALIFSGCESPRAEAERLEKEHTQAKTDFGIDTLYTVAHDGHRFIVFSGYQRGGILHHPDCCK